MLERRKEKRIPVYLLGKLTWGAYHFRVNCLVHNVCTRGAKLVLQFPIKLPPEFRLVISPGQFRNRLVIGCTRAVLAAGFECDAQQRWQIKKAFGVELANLTFVDRIDRKAA